MQNQKQTTMRFMKLQLSMCSEFIDKFENKYQTLIGENGLRLSGGETKTFYSKSIQKIVKLFF